MLSAPERAFGTCRHARGAAQRSTTRRVDARAAAAAAAAATAPPAVAPRRVGPAASPQQPSLAPLFTGTYVPPPPPFLAASDDGPAVRLAGTSRGALLRAPCDDDESQIAGPGRRRRAVPPPPPLLPPLLTAPVRSLLQPPPAWGEHHLALGGALHARAATLAPLPPPLLADDYSDGSLDGDCDDPLERPGEEEFDFDGPPGDRTPASSPAVAPPPAPGGRVDWAALKDGLLMGHEHEAMPDAEFGALLRSVKGLREAWRPMVSYLWSLGLREAELCRLAAKEPQVFVGNVGRARSRVAYLVTSFCLSPADVVRVLEVAPRVMFLHIERMAKRAAFLESLSLPRARWGRLLARHPGFLYTTVDTMEPRVAYLSYALRLSRDEVGRLVDKHPKLLSNNEAMFEARLTFLFSLGLDDAGVRRMVCSHPQILNYTPESMAPRVEWLTQEVGMSPDEAAKTCARLSQLFSLSVERSLRPKFEYLTNQLGGSKATLLECPTYLSLSLAARIVPRHLFMASLGRAATPFNVWDLIHADARFVGAARSTLEQYNRFKAELIAGSGAAGGSIMAR